MNARPSTELLLYRFGPDARFEGQIVGALERIETGGSMRVLDALFVSSDPDTGELSAIGLQGGGSGGMTSRLLRFRIDPAERSRATRRALDSGTETMPATTVHEIGDSLGRGCAIAAVLVQHVWSDALEDAVSRIGGTTVSREFVEAKALGDLSPSLLAAARL